MMKILKQLAPPQHEAKRRVLYIKARQPASVNPVIDSLTRRMAYALNNVVAAGTYQAGHLAERGRWMGVHECVCGARSTNQDYLLEGNIVTNALCVHYLAHHRNEVPPEEQYFLERALPLYQDQPTAEQLTGK